MDKLGKVGKNPVDWGVYRWKTVDNHVESVDFHGVFPNEYTQPGLYMRGTLPWEANNILRNFAFNACLEIFLYVILRYA